MNPLIKLKQAVIVEGKYDKITLENIIDTTIIATNGFSVFKNLEKRQLIKTLAEKNGIIVMTDSDSAGAIIRSHLKQICPSDSIINVYIPQILGKEKRKNRYSKEGLLGVEGMTQDVILNALKRSGIDGENILERSSKKISKTLLFDLGLSGRENSSLLRDDLARHLDLPTGISANALLDCINAVFEYDEFIEAVNIWQKNRQGAVKK